MAYIYIYFKNWPILQGRYHTWVEPSKMNVKFESKLRAVSLYVNVYGNSRLCNRERGRERNPNIVQCWVRPAWRHEVVAVVCHQTDLPL